MTNEPIQTACARAPYAETMIVGKSSHIFITHAMAEGRAECGASMKYGTTFEMSDNDLRFIRDRENCGRCRRILRSRRTARYMALYPELAVSP